MFTDSKLERNKKLASIMQSIPFIYSDILAEQITCSVLSNDEHTHYYCVFFDVSNAVRRLPPWTDVMPLSWQMLVNDVPVLFQLFIKNGFIDKLEIIDMGFQRIPWEDVWDADPILDFEYDNQYVCSYLTSAKVLVEKVHNNGCAIDLAIKSQRGYVIACFRNCHIRTLESNMQHWTRFNIICKENGKYSVSSTDYSIDFECSLLYLKLHTIID